MQEINKNYYQYFAIPTICLIANFIYLLINACPKFP